MEDPLELLASADWIKDYDPLFELFDEEMRSSDSETPTTSDIIHASASGSSSLWSNDCCTLYSANNNYVDPIVDLNQHLYHYHYQSYYQNYHQSQQQQQQQSPVSTTNNYQNQPSSPQCQQSITVATSAAACKQQQTDELSVILGLDLGIPCIVNNYDTTSSQINDRGATTNKLLGEHQTNNNNNSNNNNNNSTEGTSDCNSNSSSAMKKRRKKCLRMNKGVSLLARPAPHRQISKQLAKLCIIIEHSYASVVECSAQQQDQKPAFSASDGGDSTPKPKCDCHK